MSKINRFDGDVKAFASESTGTNRTIFGEVTQSDELTDQINADFKKGWEIVGASEFPSLQDFSAAQFTATQFISYLHQMGVAEWNVAQEYPTEGALCVYNGDLWIRGSDWVLGDEPGASANWNSTQKQLISDLTVTVGAAGDYPTINEALTHLSKLSPIVTTTGITATISLLAGFSMQEQVLIKGLNLGWVTITGIDAETTVESAYLTTDFTAADYDFNSFPLFGVSKGGVLPRIGALFNFDVANVGGNKHGVMAVEAGSSAEVLPGCGVKQAGTHGIYADLSSTINAESAIASGAGTFGIVAYRGSTINAEDAIASGAGTYGIYAYGGSTINAAGADASGAVGPGICTYRGSTINASSATGTLSQAANTVTSSGIIFQ